VGDISVATMSVGNRALPFPQGMDYCRDAENDDVAPHRMPVNLVGYHRTAIRSRSCKLSADCGPSARPIASSSYLMKSPAQRFTSVQAHEQTEAFPVGEEA